MITLNLLILGPFQAWQTGGDLPDDLQPGNLGHIHIRGSEGGRITSSGEQHDVDMTIFFYVR